MAQLAALSMRTIAPTAAAATSKIGHPKGSTSNSIFIPPAAIVALVVAAPFASNANFEKAEYSRTCSIYISKIGCRILNNSRRDYRHSLTSNLRLGIKWFGFD
jgi:hypothetical protein